jgi:hypothetical protein
MPIPSIPRSEMLGWDYVSEAHLYREAFDRYCRFNFLVNGEEVIGDSLFSSADMLFFFGKLRVTRKKHALIRMYKFLSYQVSEGLPLSRMCTVARTGRIRTGRPCLVVYKEVI